VNLIETEEERALGLRQLLVEEEYAISSKFMI